MPFATVAVPFDAYAALPTPQHRWILMCLARYADRNGVCWPSMRQLAADARVSPATICRRLKDMADLGVFQRERQGVGRYRYTLAEAYVPRWNPRVSPPENRVPQEENIEARQRKQERKRPDVVEIPHHPCPTWEPRLRAWTRSRFWLPMWGPKPTEPGCWAPQALAAAPC